jgi:hypothetical protein
MATERESLEQRPLGCALNGLLRRVWMTDKVEGVSSIRRRERLQIGLEQLTTA